MAVVLTALLLGGSTRPVYKYLPFPLVCSVLMLIGGFFLYWLIIANLERWARTDSPLLRLDRVLIASIIGLVAAVSYVVFPIAAALRGKTAHEAMIMAGSSFLTNGSMYGSTLPGGVPISPGPGWILLNLPFLNPLTYWLLRSQYVSGLRKGRFKRIHPGPGLIGTPPGRVDPYIDPFVRNDEPAIIIASWAVFPRRAAAIGKTT